MSDKAEYTEKKYRCPECEEKRTFHICGIDRAGNVRWTVCTECSVHVRPKVIRPDKKDSHDSIVKICESCGGKIDALNSGSYRPPNSEKWWHEECYDRLEMIENIQDNLSELVPAPSSRGEYSDNFYRHLMEAEENLKNAVRKEELRREQKET